jgi:hypothetical protein
VQVELAECREKAALGWGRYKHNQQLEELRNLQEQLQEERRLWQETRQEQQQDLHHKKETMARLQVRQTGCRRTSVVSQRIRVQSSC